LLIAGVGSGRVFELDAMGHRSAEHRIDPGCRRRAKIRSSGSEISTEAIEI
jgi:hypothetical protein